MKHREYIAIISQVATNSLKEALVKGMIKNLPFLAFGPWNIVLVKVAGKIAEMVLKEAEMQVFFKYIDFRTDAQAKDFETAMLYNHTIQRIGTDAEKIRAEQLLKDALTELVHLKR